MASSFERYDPDQPFTPWAIGFARNKVLHHLRSHKRDRHVFDEELVGWLAQANVDQAEQYDVRRDALAFCLEHSPEKVKSVLGLRYVREMEVGKTDIEEFIVTHDMHSRKKLMFDNSQAVVLLPGGAGTLDEFFEVLTWRQLSLHEKPIILLNVAGYWEPLLGLIDHVIDRGFAHESLREFITVTPDVHIAVALLKNHFGNWHRDDQPAV